MNEKETKYFSCCFIALLIFGLVLLGVCMVSKSYWKIYIVVASITVGLFGMVAIGLKIYSLFDSSVKVINDTLIVLDDDRNKYTKHSNIKSIFFFSDNEILEQGQFAGLEKLERIHLPKNLKEIPCCTFAGCESLAEIEIPESVTKIGEYAFYGCTSLKTITIPSSVKRIGSQAFDSSKLNSVTFKDTANWYYTDSNECTNGTELSSTALANTAIAAEYLRSIYCKKSFYKK